ncbi:MAG TPA: YihY/virulence factor BrkB family protein [Candidatus Saccharimonadales bacterium]|nr:YihY/virulence factor BrkB family protein [Candidatus Saccharimonadales bacterium]
MNIFEKLMHRVDSYQRAHPRASFLYAVVKKYGDDQAGHQAALMAYYGFLSLFPLLLVLTTVVKVFLNGHPQLQDKLINGITEYLPMIGNSLEKNVHGVGGGGIALALGILFTLYGARGVADIFRFMVNQLWEIPHVKRTGFPWSILRSMRIIIVGGIGLLLAPFVSGYAASAGHGLLFWFSSLIITLIILFGIFLYLLYASLPHRHSFHDMWPGALLAAIGLVILQSLGSWLLTRQLKHLGDLYGTFAIVLGLFFWLYLQAQVIVYALEAGTVRALRLYPRALAAGHPTEADRRAYKLYMERNRFFDEEHPAPEENKKDT